MTAGKIVFLVSHTRPGGVQEIWRDIAEAMSARGHDAESLALYPFQIDEPATAGRDYVVEQKPAWPWQGLSLLSRLAHRFRKSPPAAVVSAMPAANAAAIVAMSIAGVKKPILISHHTPIDTYHPLLRLADAPLGRSSNVKAIICVSQAVSASLNGRSKSYRDKRLTIHNALPPDIEQIIAGLAAGRQKRARRRKIIVNGRLAPQKNVPFILRALAKVEDCELVIVGEGPQDAELRELAQSLNLKAKFLGLLPRKDALAQLADADIFAQPSLFEGHSLALIEAASMGLPLVVSNVPSQLEGITAPSGETCGIAVNPADASAFAAHVTSLLSDPELYDAWAAKSRALSKARKFNEMCDAYERALRDVGAIPPASDRSNLRELERPAF